jgi:hypothetical protein
MKKAIVMILVVIPVLFASCATVLGGRISECQRTKPLPGEPSRKVRIGYLITDILFSPLWIVDFATGAIYKPCN